MSRACTVYHRDPANDTVSDTGEITSVAYDSGTTVYGFLYPSVPASRLEEWGVSLDADAVLMVSGDSDVRPATDESNGLGDKVVIGSTTYQVVSVVKPDPEVRGSRLAICGLRRMA